MPNTPEYLSTHFWTKLGHIPEHASVLLSHRDKQFRPLRDNALTVIAWWKKTQPDVVKQRNMGNQDKAWMGREPIVVSLNNTISAQEMAIQGMSGLTLVTSTASFPIQPLLGTTVQSLALNSPADMAEQDFGNPNGSRRQRDLGTKRAGLMPDAPMETMGGLANQTGDDSGQTTIFNPDRRHGAVAGTCGFPTPTAMDPRPGQNSGLTVSPVRPYPIPTRGTSQSASALAGPGTNIRHAIKVEPEDDDSWRDDGKTVERQTLVLGPSHGKRYSLPALRQLPLPVPVLRAAASPSPLASRSTGSFLPPLSANLGGVTAAPRKSLRILARDSACDGMLGDNNSPQLFAPPPTQLRTPQAQQPTRSTRDWSVRPARRPTTESIRQQYVSESPRNSAPLRPGQLVEASHDAVAEQLKPLVAADHRPSAPSREATVATGDISITDTPAPAPFDGIDNGTPDCIWIVDPQPDLSSPPPVSTGPPTPASQSASSSPPHPTEKLTHQAQTTPPRRITTRSSIAANPITTNSNHHALPPPSSPGGRRRRKSYIRRARASSLPSPSSKAPVMKPHTAAPAAAPPLPTAPATNIQTFTTTPIAEASFVNSAEERSELVRLYKRHGGKIALVRRDLPFSRGRPGSDTLRLLGILAEVEEVEGGVTLSERQRARLSLGEGEE